MLLGADFLPELLRRSGRRRGLYLLHVWLLNGYRSGRLNFVVDLIRFECFAIQCDGVLLHRLLLRLHRLNVVDHLALIIVDILHNGRLENHAIFPTNVQIWRRI